MSKLPGGVRDPGQGPVLLALRRPRRLVDNDTPTQVALAQLGIELIPAYLARGKGALGALGSPEELRLAGITDMVEAKAFRFCTRRGPGPPWASPARSRRLKRALQAPGTSDPRLDQGPGRRHSSSAAGAHADGQPMQTPRPRASRQPLRDRGNRRQLDRVNSSSAAGTPQARRDWSDAVPRPNRLRPVVMPRQ